MIPPARRRPGGHVEGRLVATVPRRAELKKGRKPFFNGLINT
jgi:hypothetical protein